MYLAARMTFMVSLLITCPLVIFPVRESICATYLSLGAKGGSTSPSRPAPDAEAGGARRATVFKGAPSSAESSPLIGSGAGAEAERAAAAGGAEARAGLRLVVTLAVVVAGLVIASVVRRLDLVVGIVGAFAGGLLMYTVPAAVAFVTIVRRGASGAMTWAAVAGALADAPASGRLHAGALLAMGAFGVALSITGTALQFVDR